ncbi:MAG: NAD(P)H-hydrate epimerase [Eggerthellaceae bacterium]|nr:NAD(P)H-hydrate epimerase [Eggerthellaceae bacterium]
MKPLLTGRGAGLADRHSIDAGIPSMVLMERAALALVQACRERALPMDAVCVVCGSGNNGGDGWVAARHLLDDGHAVCLVTPRPAEELRAEPAREAALRAHGALAEGGAHILVGPGARTLDALLAESDLVIDAILGTGFSGDTVKEPYATWIRACNAAHDAGATVVAADVPSGLSAQTGHEAAECIRADHTVTMIVPKPGLDHPAAGTVHTAPLAYIEPLFDTARRLNVP